MPVRLAGDDDLVAAGMAHRGLVTAIDRVTEGERIGAQIDLFETIEFLIHRIYPAGERDATMHDADLSDKPIPPLPVVAEGTGFRSKSAPCPT